MSADAIERLRTRLGDGRRFEDCRRADLRALLDAHDEALDALERIENPDNWGPDGSWDEKNSYPDEIARDVLAKAGRR